MFRPFRAAARVRPRLVQLSSPLNAQLRHAPRLAASNAAASVPAADAVLVVHGQSFSRLAAAGGNAGGPDHYDLAPIIQAIKGAVGGGDDFKVSVFAHVSEGKGGAQNEMLAKNLAKVGASVRVWKLGTRQAASLLTATFVSDVLGSALDAPGSSKPRAVAVVANPSTFAPMLRAATGQMGLRVLLPCNTVDELSPEWQHLALPMQGEPVVAQPSSAQALVAARALLAVACMSAGHDLLAAPVALAAIQGDTQLQRLAEWAGTPVASAQEPVRLEGGLEVSVVGDNGRFKSAADLLQQWRAVAAAWEAEGAPNAVKAALVSAIHRLEGGSGSSSVGGDGSGSDGSDEWEYVVVDPDAPEDPDYEWETVSEEEWVANTGTVPGSADGLNLPPGFKAHDHGEASAPAADDDSSDEEASGRSGARAASTLEAEDESEEEEEGSEEEEDEEEEEEEEEEKEEEEEEQVEAEGNVEMDAVALDLLSQIESSSSVEAGAARDLAVFLAAALDQGVMKLRRVGGRPKLSDNALALMRKAIGLSGWSPRGPKVLPRSLERLSQQEVLDEMWQRLRQQDK